MPMNATTVTLFDEQRLTLITAATLAREQAQACEHSLRLMPVLQAGYRNRAAALRDALAALDANAHPGDLASELHDLQVQHAALQRQFDAERARGDALAAALSNALERLGQHGDSKGCLAARATLAR